MVICGDCLYEMGGMGESSIDAVVTDPPYGIGFKYNEKEAINNADEYGKFITSVFNEVKRLLRNGGFFAFWQPATYFKHYWKWFGDDIHIYAACKNFVQLRKTPINYGFDPVVMGYCGKPELRPAKPQRSLDFFVANTAKYVTEKNTFASMHPCPRPIDQVIEIVSNFTKEGGVILDPFMGSGTLAEACIKTGRNFIGIEKEEEYCKIAEARIKSVQGGLI